MLIFDDQILDSEWTNLKQQCIPECSKSLLVFLISFLSGLQNTILKRFSDTMEQKETNKETGPCGKPHGAKRFAAEALGSSQTSAHRSPKRQVSQALDLQSLLRFIGLCFIGVAVFLFFYMHRFPQKNYQWGWKHLKTTADFTDLLESLLNL